MVPRHAGSPVTFRRAPPDASAVARPVFGSDDVARLSPHLAVSCVPVRPAVIAKTALSGVGEAARMWRLAPTMASGGRKPAFPAPVLRP